MTKLQILIHKVVGLPPLKYLLPNQEYCCWMVRVYFFWWIVLTFIVCFAICQSLSVSRFSFLAALSSLRCLSCTCHLWALSECVTHHHGGPWWAQPWSRPESLGHIHLQFTIFAVQNLKRVIPSYSLGLRNKYTQCAHLFAELLQLFHCVDLSFPGLAELTGVYQSSVELLQVAMSFKAERKSGRN